MTGVAPWGPPPAYRRLSRAETEALAAVYADVDAALVEAVRACRACGQCCRFHPGGIILFATAMELAYLMGEKPVPVARPPSAANVAQPPSAGQAAGQAQPGAAGLQEVDAEWTCLYQQGDLCAARDRRLLGCRTYSCDNEARGAGEEVCIGALARIRRLAAAADLAWYGPVRLCLSSWAAAER